MTWIVTRKSLSLTYGSVLPHSCTWRSGLSAKSFASRARSCSRESATSSAGRGGRLRIPGTRVAVLSLVVAIVVTSLMEVTLADTSDTVRAFSVRVSATPAGDPTASDNRRECRDRARAQLNTKAHESARSTAATFPDRTAVADITYVPTSAGFVHVAVADAWSRSVVGRGSTE